jgi:manganese oxidase
MIQVNDTLEITFYNKASRPYTMHPHGVKYTPANEGVFNKYSTGLNGSAVAPNTTYTYEVHTRYTACSCHANKCHYHVYNIACSSC